jgi:hypothetical protein
MNVEKRTGVKGRVRVGINAISRIILGGVLVFASGLFMPRISWGDQMPDHSIHVGRSLKVVNLNEFPEVVLIGFYQGYYVSLLGDHYRAYQIENNKEWKKENKINHLSVYWTTKKKFQSMNLKHLAHDEKVWVQGWN